MLMPFGSAFTVNNVGIPIEKLTLIYLFTGLCAMIAGPLVGQAQRQHRQVPAVLRRVGASPSS